MSFRKGKCLKALKQLDEAVKCFYQIIKENDHFPADISVKVNAYMRKNNTNKI